MSTEEDIDIEAQLAEMEMEQLQNDDMQVSLIPFTAFKRHLLVQHPTKMSSLTSGRTASKLPSPSPFTVK